MTEQKLILIVDDDNELSDGIRAVLEREGHKVIQARDGQQGKNLIYHHRPDLVILDMMMPRMGGSPVLEPSGNNHDAQPFARTTANAGRAHKAPPAYLAVLEDSGKPFAMEK